MFVHCVCWFLLTFMSNILQTYAYFERESFTIIVGRGEKTCLSKSFTESVRVVFEYRVTEGGNRDIDAKIISPNGMVIYKERKIQGDEISFLAQDGDFKFCFSNEFSQITDKRVAFNIRPRDLAGLSEEAGKSKAEVKGPMEVFCDDIHLLMTSIVQYQMKYRVRESMGRYVAENLNKIVTYWSIGQAIFILVAGWGQVFVFKTFFTEKRASTKPAVVKDGSVIET